MLKARARRLACSVWLTLTAVVLSGCGLFRGRPTPLPWLPTDTPPATAGPQAGVTSSPTATVAPEPTATETAQPAATKTPLPSATPEPPSQVITLDVPAEGATVSNPIRIRGQAKVMPFEGTLVIRVYDAAGEVAVEEPIIATGDLGGPATFEAEITAGGRPGPGRIEVADLSPQDGSVLARAAVDVTLAGFPGGGYIELPAAQTDVVLPIRLLARVGVPAQKVSVTVTWDDGTEFEQGFTTLPGLDDRGLLVVALGAVPSLASTPPTQAATIRIRTTEGSPLASQRVRILAPDDPGTMGTQVFWAIDETVVPQGIRIPRTLGIGRASLEVLLWGPVPENPEGFTTFIPSPADVLAYPGRGPDWGERVRLQSLRIEDGVAYADFSIELRAHAGGAMVTALMREQIESTLTQFSTVEQVVISVDGVTGVLEP